MTRAESESRADSMVTLGMRVPATVATASRRYAPARGTSKSSLAVTPWMAQGSLMMAGGKGVGVQDDPSEVELEAETDALRVAEALSESETEAENEGKGES